MRIGAASKRISRVALRLSLLAAALCALLSASSAQAATYTVGSPLTASFTSSLINSTGTFTDTALPEPGANVASPVTGVIVRWRITGATGGPFSLRVLTPIGGPDYTGAASSFSATPSSVATQTFATRMPIHAGQVIGIDNTNSTDHIGAITATGASYLYWVPPLAYGSTRAGTGPATGELGFNADVVGEPGVSSLSPASGPPVGGTAVTIAGHDFAGATAVKFGGVAARSFTVNSDTSITAVSPAGSPGAVDVVVTTTGGQSPSTSADRFAYIACVVPKLKGKTLKAARKALKKAHCKLGKVKGPKGKKARIKKQKPKAGTVLAAGSKVKVTTKKKK